MTTLQKIVTEAKKIRKAHPKKYAKWTDYVKEASKKYKAAPVKKKVGNYKLNRTEFDETRIPIKPRKKTEKKKKVYAVTRAHGGQFKKITRVGATHSDKGSHNTTIRVVSGTRNMYTVRDGIEKEITFQLSRIEEFKNKKKNKTITPAEQKRLTYLPTYIRSLKAQLREQNKHITQSLK